MGKASTCIYKNTAIIYIPSINNSSSTLYQVLLFVIWVNLGLALIVEILF